MCGIAGCVLLEGPARESVVRTMCRQIRHRGPDDEGFFRDDLRALGMRRLSIIYYLSTGLLCREAARRISPCSAV
jgi:asparagine synthase (glutamine-hydrolysing)